MPDKPCCEKVSVAYDNGRIYCASCDKDLPKILEASQVETIVTGYTRTINWDRHIWSFPLSLSARIKGYTTWAQVRQAYLELFEEARKDVNNMVRAHRDELVDPSRRPESLQ